MIRHVPAQAAEMLSVALWELARPPHVRDPKDGSLWLRFDPGFVMNVHPDAELGAIADILTPWIGHGITQEDIDALAAVVEGHRGGRMTPWEAFPQLFKERSKSHQNMIDAGLLAGQPEVPPP